MKELKINLVLISMFMIITVVISTSYAQQNASLILRPPPVDIKNIVFSISPLVEVEYQGESIVVLKADEDTLLLANGTITPFWLAVDAVKHYGYTVDDIATSGMGSQGNPTRFYAVMSKP
jgi:hypothetical protein